MKFIQFAGICFLGAGMAACNKDFLQREPKTEVVKENFFKTPENLETYSNDFYTQFNDHYGYDGFGYDEVYSDNVSTYIGGGELLNMLNGTLSPATVSAGTWNTANWGSLRSINYMLENAGLVTGDEAAIRHYIGIARFFRARFYMTKVKRFSNVPWYGKAMSNTDADLYKPADPRALVSDSILGDLEYAVANIKTSAGEGTRVSKEAALALMSRYCLFEGTYRKYHPELGLAADHERFLEKSVWAAEQLIAGNKYTIVGGGAEGYRNLFCSSTLAGNKEMIQWRASNKELGIANNSANVLNYQWGLSRSLQETYLMADGARFTEQAGYDTKGYVDVFQDRDPRLAETFAAPGFSPNPAPSAPVIPLSTLGGYVQVKFYPRDPLLRGGFALYYTALPIYRYAEVLLNYAEAKAELGTVTQTDIDKSINLIRARVSMPAMDMAAANGNVDPVLADYYPNVAGANQGLILEIRRERRVELACEGFRFDDLQRWYAGKRLGDDQQGMYVPALGGVDVTGDGIPDVAILPSVKDTASIKDLPADVRGRLSRFYLTNANGTPGNFYLTNGTSGHIAFTVDKTKLDFQEPKFYYRPIPQVQLVLNPKLEQPFGW